MDDMIFNSNNRLSDKAFMALFGLYFMLKPFYLWENGLPQVSDIVLLTAIILYILKNKLRINIFQGARQYILINFLFIFYISFINILWSLILNGEFSFFKSSMFYVFNFMAAIIVISSHYEYGERIFRLIYFSVLASIALQFIVFSFSGGFTGNRAVAYFNNPNQLGYHSLLTLALLLCINGKLSINGIWLFTGIFFSFTLCLASLSKAAIISFSGMLLYSVLLHIRNWIFARKSNKVFLVLMLIIAVITVYYLNNKEAFSSSFLFESVKYRLSTIGQSGDDNLSQRGYDRVLEYSQYLLFGAGEGMYSRFRSTIEIHSTVGNILMSYGLIGVFLYIAILFAACKKNRWEGLYIIAFITLYGLTHNGIRNTFFWIIISLIYSVSFKYEHKTGIKSHVDFIGSGTVRGRDL